MHNTDETLVQHERRTLADDLISYGPDAPTILEGWDASDLLEHLLVREGRQDLMVGPKLPIAPLARAAERSLEKLRETPWSEQVARFRAGPPRLSPMRPLNSVANTVEYFVHHEDLRRARPGWEARALSPAHESELWSRLRTMARMLVRAEVDVTLVSTHGGIRIPAKTRRGADATGAVRVHGAPGELLLWAYGRDQVTDLEVEGDPQSLLALRRSRRGF